MSFQPADLAGPTGGGRPALASLPPVAYSGVMRKIKLVILDAHATNPGDLSWGPIEELADCAIYPRTPPADVLARVGDAEAVMLNKGVLAADTIRRAPRLRYVGILATGWNTIDLPAAKERGLVVSNVPGYSTDSVAQHTFALLLELTNQVGMHSADARAGGWAGNPDYCYRLSPQSELAGLTLGIIGFGQIGQAVARIGQAFGMTVLANRRDQSQRLPPGVRYASVDRIFAESDVVSLHCPLTPETAGLVNAQRLATMKPSAFLLNASRGPLIVESDLAAALAAGRLAGAAVDVLSTEPPAPDNPLLRAPHCVVTPHLAWATAAARQRLIQIAAANLRAYLAGKPVHQVPLD